jgi:uncharacterized repeat protein (TIGR03806 family)
VKRAAATLLFACAALACGGGGVRARLDAPYPERLSEWRLFRGRTASLEPNDGVLPYDVGVPLFSDHAFKYRTLWMPPAAAAEYRADGPFEFPTGTVFSKTFYYRRGAEDQVSSTPAGVSPGGLVGRPEERRLIETRLLVRGRSGWVALPYVWDDAQQDATLQIAGEERRLTWISPGRAREAFVYLVPNTDQCAGCHVSVVGRERPLRPLGPTARQLNVDFAYAEGRANQLARWQQRGLLRDAPAAPTAPRWELDGENALATRARAYLDVQCAHCHSPRGPAAASGLYLGHEETAPERLGVCKPPVAAGRGSGGLLYDIVPGRPDDSILFYRMVSREPDVMMPELGRSLRDDAGLELVRAYIASLPGSCS